MIVICFIILIVVNIIVISKTRKYIDCNTVEYNYILVLGASVKNGKPSKMLADRLDKAIELYVSGKKIIISGDHQSDDYNETGVMKEYLINNGVLEEDIIIDDYGISTYDSMYRLKYVYNIDGAVVVTQKYHLYRAVYLGNKMGIKTYGVSAKRIIYGSQFNRDIREVLARFKDYFKVIFKFKSKYN